MSQAGTLSDGNTPAGSSCHFQAYLNANQIIGASAFTTVIFNATTTNVGSAYNVATGIFTAPATDFYSFECTLWNEMNTSGAQTELLISYIGSVQTNRLFQNGSGAWSSAVTMIVSSSWSMPMTAGDTVQIQAYATGAGTFTEIGGALGTATGTGYCTFSGFSHS
jgi:hypothetical protein